MISDADKRIQLGILGATLAAPNCRTAADRLSQVPERWFTLKNCAAIRQIILAAGGMDAHALGTKMMAEGTFAGFGGDSLLADLAAAEWLTDDRFAWTVEMLRDGYVRHEIDMLTETIKEALGPDQKPEERISLMESAITKIRQTSQPGNQSFGHIKHAVQRLSDNLDAAQDDLRADRHLFAVPTGIASLDRHLFAGGFRAGQLVLVAARPGKGKSSFMVTAAMNMAFAGRIVGIISLEMTAEDLAEVGVQMTGDIRVREFYKRIMGEGETIKFMAAAGAVGEKSIWVDDSAGLSVEQVASRAANMVREFGCEVVFLDYAQRVRIPYKASRYEEMTAVSERLTECAKDLKVPLVAMAQLNREAGENERPKIEHIKETGQWEQDAHIILMLHRPNANEPTEKLSVQPFEPMEIILGKQRRGAASMIIPATFNRETQRIA